MTISKKAEYIVHFDDDSFGVYDLKSNVKDVNLGENAPSNLPKFKLGSFRYARVAEEQLEVFGQVTPMKQDARMNVNFNKPITDWLVTSPFTAPVVLIQSLPSFWLNRFRFSSKHRNLQNENTKFNLTPLLEERKHLREDLIQHNQSLEQKLWTIRYHRENLMNALKKLDTQSTSSYYLLVCASAEYNALLACMYATLEELTHVFYIFEKIRTRKDRSDNFHDLHKNRDKETDDLRLILEEAKWYEQFRLRRANSSHAFGAIVALLDEKSTDLYLMQHPNHRIYNKSVSSPPFKHLIREEIPTIINGFDRLLEQFSIFLISLFHPWDLVVITNGSMEELQETCVWVRHILFNENNRSGSDSWVSIDKDGQIEFQAKIQGGLSTE